MADYRCCAAVVGKGPVLWVSRVLHALARDECQQPIGQQSGIDNRFGKARLLGWPLRRKAGKMAEANIFSTFFVVMSKVHIFDHTIMLLLLRLLFAGCYSGASIVPILKNCP